MKIFNKKSTKLVSNNNEVVNLKVGNLENNVQVIKVDAPHSHPIIIEINTDNKLYDFLIDYYADFEKVWKAENFTSPITRWYCDERAHYRAYCYSNGEGVDLFNEHKKEKVITFLSDRTFYNQEENKNPFASPSFDSLKIKYSDDLISLIFEKQTDEEFVFSDIGPYTYKRFESAYFFHLLLELAEKTIEINNGEKVKTLVPNKKR